MNEAVGDLLRQSMGLEPSSIGAATVERAWRGRMAAVGAATPEDYFAHLRETPSELAELIERVVVPESWFFRDGAPFVSLVRWAREKWMPGHPGAALRILTVPCSTGEEPYSVAMALLGAGLRPEQFSVDAVDISRHAIARARKGLYGMNSFRGQTLEFRDHYFTPAPGAYLLAPEVRRQVHFETGNILAADFRPGAGSFDVIFCRNLLIYFDQTTQVRSIKALSTILNPGGLLFVGHAETSMPAAAGFTAAPYARSFAFQRPTSLPAPPGNPITGKYKPRPVPIPATARPSPASKALAAVALPSIPARLAPGPAAAGKVAQADLETARQLANQGKLDAAAGLCEAHLRQDGASAAAWYLLGVVRDAAGDHTRAAECYAKTLYLESDHQEALLQRALLAEQNGNTGMAAQLRRRIARVQQRSVRP